MSRLAMILAITGVVCSVVLMLSVGWLPWRSLNSDAINMMVKVEIAFNVAAVLVALVSVLVQRDSSSLRASLYSVLCLAITTFVVVMTLFGIMARHPV